MGSILGGSQSTEVKVPEYIERGGKELLAEAQKVMKIPYAPLYGPTVAAFNEADRASRSNVNAMAKAFGMAGAGDFSMPEEIDVGGVRGYSSAPLYEQALEELKTRQPGTYQAIMNQFIDPMGQGGITDFQNMTPEQRAEYIRRMYSGGRFPF